MGEILVLVSRLKKLLSLTSTSLRHVLPNNSNLLPYFERTIVNVSYISYQRVIQFIYLQVFKCRVSLNWVSHFFLQLRHSKLTAFATAWFLLKCVLSEPSILYCLPQKLQEYEPSSSSKYGSGGWRGATSSLVESAQVRTILSKDSHSFWRSTDAGSATSYDFH